MTDARHDTLETANGYAADLRATAAILRKFHGRDAAYTDLADTLEAAADEFIGHFQHIVREFEAEEQAKADAERHEQIRDYHDSVL